MMKTSVLLQLQLSNFNKDSNDDVDDDNTPLKQTKRTRSQAAAEPEILNKGGRADTLYYTWETYQDIYTCY